MIPPFLPRLIAGIAKGISKAFSHLITEIVKNSRSRYSLFTLIFKLDNSAKRQVKIQTLLSCHLTPLIAKVTRLPFLMVYKVAYA